MQIRQHFLFFMSVLVLSIAPMYKAQSVVSHDRDSLIDEDPALYKGYIGKTVDERRRNVIIVRRNVEAVYLFPGIEKRTFAFFAETSEQYRRACAIFTAGDEVSADYTYKATINDGAFVFEQIFGSNKFSQVRVTVDQNAAEQFIAELISKLKDQTCFYMVLLEGHGLSFVRPEKAQ